MNSRKRICRLRHLCASLSKKPKAPIWSSRGPCSECGNRCCASAGRKPARRKARSGNAVSLRSFHAPVILRQDVDRAARGFFTREIAELDAAFLVCRALRARAPRCRRALKTFHAHAAEDRDALTGSAAPTVWPDRRSRRDGKLAYRVVNALAGIDDRVGRVQPVQAVDEQRSADGLLQDDLGNLFERRLLVRRFGSKPYVSSSFIDTSTASAVAMDVLVTRRVERAADDFQTVERSPRVTADLPAGRAESARRASGRVLRAAPSNVDITSSNLVLAVAGSGCHVRPDGSEAAGPAR